MAVRQQRVYEVARGVERQGVGALLGHHGLDPAQRAGVEHLDETGIADPHVGRGGRGVAEARRARAPVFGVSTARRTAAESRPVRVSPTPIGRSLPGADAGDMSPAAWPRVGVTATSPPSLTGAPATVASTAIDSMTAPSG